MENVESMSGGLQKEKESADAVLKIKKLSRFGWGRRQDLPVSYIIRDKLYRNFLIFQVNDHSGAAPGRQ